MSRASCIAAVAVSPALKVRKSTRSCVVLKDRTSEAGEASPPSSTTSNIRMNLKPDDLSRQIGRAGNPDGQTVYGYVIETVKPYQGGFLQEGSGPNWDGGVITLCTCKHDMRAWMTPEEWRRGMWVAGMTGWSIPFGKQQSLVYLMRVGEAYGSHAELIFQLNSTGRGAVVKAKDSTLNQLGDLMMPRKAGVPAKPNDPAAYHAPRPDHPHSDEDGWHNDVHHPSRGRAAREAPLLVGDSAFSFLWTRPVVRRRHPSVTRPCRVWTLSEFLDDLEAVTP